MIHLQLLHCVKSSFLDNFTMIPSFNYSGTLSSSHIMLKRVCSRLSLMFSISLTISVLILSGPAALLFVSFLIDFLISSSVISNQSMSRFIVCYISISVVISGYPLFDTEQKCFFHLLICSSSLYNMFPFRSLIFAFQLKNFPHSCFVILYRVLRLR